MFKNLMNNPWFVGALGLFASIYLGWSVAQPLLFGDQEIAGASIGMELGLSGEADVSAGYTSNKGAGTTQREEIRWLHDVERDPFSGMAYSQNGSAGAPETPSIDALFISSGVRAAVVENRLVHVGDSVAQYTVTEIGEDFVELHYRGKAVRLRPEA